LRLGSVSSILCVVWLAVVAIGALFAGQVAPHSPTKQNLLARNRPPAWMEGGDWSHPFGTDQLGYDLFSRVIYGARPALEIGLLALLISVTLGTVTGLVAGYFRGRLDSLIMLLVDAQLSTPFLVIAIAAVAAFGRGTVILIVLAGLSSWMGIARAIRSQVLSLRNRDFLIASVALGAGGSRIILRHLLPNVASVIIVLTTSSMSGLILFEASMSFLGLGVPPPDPSWGSMISSGRDSLLTTWWISVVPGIALTLTVLAASLLGDSVRDRLDPTLRGVR
jgi:ABC-type dipeptide/oligopeptide/nickel transport system permease subunit